MLQGLDVLIIDDEEVIGSFLSRWLAQGGAKCRVAATGEEGLKDAEARWPDVVFLDIRLPDMGGLEVLRQLRAGPKPPEIVLISGYADVKTAVRGFREGACDLIEKPFTIARLLEGIEVAQVRRALPSRARPPARGSAPRVEPGFVACSPRMREIAGMVERVAPSDASVLIEGETGSGKEVVARRLHALSRRRDGPFVAVNCGAIPEGLLEAELFGHEAGAFTGATRRRVGHIAAAHGGVLFLDEICELQPLAQVKLLRVIQERVVVPVGTNAGTEVDIRIIAATNRDLDQDVRAGKFRLDLLFRLNVVKLWLPPLRERRADIQPLVEQLLARLAPRYGRLIERVHPEAASALDAYRYPGNVRELENILERALALGATDELTLEDLPANVLGAEQGNGEVASPSPAADTASSGVQTLDEAERSIFKKALIATGGNRQAAARMLAVSPKTVARRIKLYGL